MTAFNKIVLYLSLILAGCSTQIADTTGGIETTNGFVVLTSEGIPAANASVTFIAKDDWYAQVSNMITPVVDSTTTDSKGFFIIPEELETYPVQIDYCDEAIIIVNIPSDTIELSPYQTVRGTVPADVTELRIPGTAWRGVVTDGAFTLHIPTGIFPVLLRGSAGLSLSQTLVVEGDHSDIILEENSNSVLFDDFNGGFAQSSLGSIIDSIGWYSFTDSLRQRFSDGVWVDGELSEHNGNSFITPEIESGILTVSASIRPGASNPYAGIGADFYTNGSREINLSEMTQIRIRARGNGTVLFRLESYQLRDLGISQYQYEMTLSSDWNEFTIPVSELHLDSDDSAFDSVYPWSDISRSIQQMEFNYRATQNGTNVDRILEIDYIFFDGCSLDDL